MMVLGRARVVGGSMMVTIPREVVLEEGIASGELLELTFKRPRKSFFGMARGIGSFTKADEMGVHD